MIGGLAASLALAAAALAQPAAAPPSATASLKTPDGVIIGSVVLTEGPSGVLLRVDLKGLTPGWHGMHFHEKGDCSDPKFMSSGGHIQMPGMKMPHGLLNPEGPDYGDLPNIFVQADGTAKAEAFSTTVSLKGAQGRSALLDADGSALVIHAAADDQTSQPIGGAGARVACAVIR
ncbi:MAG: superoxide dismutase family protein [Caulobacteraceae bacterium]|nr:superoxide dismutase family protein [Caulobacteraceae bacterium]